MNELTEVFNRVMRETPLLLDFFCGGGSVKDAAYQMGWDVWGTDIAQFGHTDLIADIIEIDTARIPHSPDVAWFSPPCEAFSVASISHHWTGGKEAYIPKSDRAKLSLQIINRVWEIIKTINPRFYYIENPRGVLRKMPVMRQAPIRHTVTYCQYGDTRMKPTDIWTNNPNWTPRPMCKNGDSCHQSAPRGSSTGTQGRKTYLERSQIPAELITEILECSN